MDAALPVDPLSSWDAPRLFLTSTTAALHAEFQPRLERFVQHQVARYLAGESLVDTVDPLSDFEKET